MQNLIESQNSSKRMFFIIAKPNKETSVFAAADNTHQALTKCFLCICSLQSHSFSTRQVSQAALLLLLLLLLSCFSRVRFCAIPETHQDRPWDSPGKSTTVGCHCLLQRMKVKSESEVAQSCLTPMDCSLPGSSTHGIFQATVREWGAIASSEAALYPE